ncbi:MAG TPA: sigma-70 family RNA polymerase sigma factor [Pyrinomonadaceae bacterium]|nr:sigma-70 family RNA polymerase sigma factor [Pyrinomonadaceae bacterium]
MGVATENREEALLPHLDAAYNLARWLTRDERDAEDVVQEAYLRALKHFHTFKGGDARPWLLKIVRNTYYTLIRRNRVSDAMTPFEEEEDVHISDAPDPEMLLVKETDRQLVRRALQKLPTEFLEVIVLREFEELSYKQIADTVQVPVGTVMSRLARARGRLAQIISSSRGEVGLAL